MKSSGRILGPFSYAELGTLLAEKRLSYLDEVKESFDRWRFIREHPKLKTLVAKVRESEMEAEEPGTAKASLKTVTDFEIPMESPEEEIKEVKAGKEKTTKKKSLAFTIAITLLMMTAAGFLYQFQQKKRAALIYRLNNVAASSYLVGDYSDSYNAYKQIAELKKLNFEDNIKFLLLQTVVEKETVEARRQISELQDDNRDLKRIEVLTYVAEKDFVKAEDLNDKLLSNDPLNQANRLNQVSLALLNSEAHKAETKLQELDNTLVNHPMIYSLKALTALSLSEEPEGIEKLKTFVLNNWEKFTSLVDYYPENLFLMAVIEAKIGHEVETQKWLELLFSLPVNQSANMRKDLGLIHTLLEWPQLHPYCNWMVDQTKEAILKAKLQAYCHLRNEDYSNAESTLNGALAQSPDNSSLLQMKAGLLLTLNRNDEAKASLKLITEPSALSKFYESEVCDGLECEMAKIQDSLNLDKDLLVSQAAEISLLIKQSKRLLAQEKLLQGLKAAPNFKPFLRLQEERQ